MKMHALGNDFIKMFYHFSLLLNFQRLILLRINDIFSQNEIID